MQFKLNARNTTGYAIFISSLILYTLTLEPTNSFWDCSEFILSAAKLEVNHPAGAPLFMLTGRLFTLFSFGNPEKIAWTINFMSGFFSALTVFFLYHVVIQLVHKISGNNILITGSAAIAAISFAVSDSFWFSAVEGEVYALSMFFLILSFWVVLKWEDGFGQAGNEKWIFFLALITGLGIGIHLLNLLVLPTAAMIIGFRKYNYSLKKLFLFFTIGVIVLFGVLYLLTPLIMNLLAGVDYIFVNKINVPLHTGALFAIALLLLAFGILLYYFRQKEKIIAETITLSVLFFLIGFSVYSVNIIRSSANPPINFGRPNNVYSLINYLNREQYPKRPLVFGQNYNSPITKINDRYSKDYLNGKYQTTDLSPSYEFDSKTCTWFPRMYSREERHIQAYNSWIDIKGKQLTIKNGTGEIETIKVPLFSDQLKYFVKYQFGYMFGRYFMWNFVGRQNDIQGRGEPTKGNWISGINFIDNSHVGPQNNLPDWMKNNPARNTYFFLPLLLGIIGAYFHYKKHRPSFFAILALFSMGSIGLSIYINEVPVTPRERDYVFVVAFLAFSIWIGMSFLAIASHMGRLTKKHKFSIPLLLILFASGPGLMAFQNFDDHDRSDRYIARDLAANMLHSCPADAILFTSGDNDTYPLLYCQEVEGIRTDVRIVILPFLSANWFIDGLREPKYNDPGLKMALPQNRYDYGKLDYIPVLDKLNRDTSWNEAFNFLKLDNENAKVKMRSGDKVNFLPLTQVNFQVTADGKTGTVPISLKGKNILYKNQIAFWDIVSSNATLRPVCFASKSEAKNYGLNNHLRCEGFVYRLVPEKSETASMFSIGNCNPDELYTKLTREFKWGNISDPSVYADWNSFLNLNIFQVRNVFNEVALLLLQKGEKEKASELLKLCSNKIPLSKIPYDIFSFRQAEIMVQAGMNQEALQLISILETGVLQSLEYYFAFPETKRRAVINDIQRELIFLNNLVRISTSLKNQDKAKELNAKLNEFVKELE